MKKEQTIYSCSKCNAQFPKWAGRCTECQAWGTIAEGMTNDKAQMTNARVDSSRVINFGTYTAKTDDRLATGINEVDRVFGGGIVEGSLTLMGGEPGVGKSTLVLQIAQNIKGPVLYASGEESANQIKIRIDRLGFKLDNVSFIPENNIEQILAFTRTQKPALLIVDSIQTMYSSELEIEAGGINQVRVCTVKLLEMAKQSGVPVIIIGHVTKEGMVAGPKMLEHLVDTVIYLESSTKDNYRILRPQKNRFGSTDELGIFEMTGKGLIEVSNPSNLFWTPQELQTSGTMNTCLLEGSRCFIVEIQSLVTKTQFGYPQRKSAGFEINRLQMLAAVLIKRTKLKLEMQDIHLNVTGGFRINETGADLAVCLSIFSSFSDIIPKQKTIAIGEVGLSGEIRSVQGLEKRVDEALRLGFEKIIVPASSKMAEKKGVVKVKTLVEAFQLI